MSAVIIDLSPRDSGQPLKEGFAENADDLLFQAEGQSHEDWTKAVSRALGIPVAIFYLDQLPYADQVRAGEWLMRQQTRKRARWLKTAAGSAVQFPRKAWNRLGTCTGAVITRDACLISENDQHSGLLPLRLTGDSKQTKACILLPDREVDARSYGRWMTAIPQNQLERWPEIRASSIWVHMHEFAHGLQRLSPALDFTHDWTKEYDADRFACEKMLARADKLEQAGDTKKAREYRESVDAWKKARALKGVINSANIYWNALAFDAVERGQPMPSPKDCKRAGVELKLTIAAYALGLTLADMRELSHAVVASYDVKMPRKTASPFLRLSLKYEMMCKDSGGAVILPILRHLLERGQFEGLAKRNAELVIEAAEYFCPALLTGPVPQAQSRQSMPRRILSGLRRGLGF